LDKVPDPVTDNHSDSGPETPAGAERALRVIRAIEAPQTNLPTLPAVAIEISRLTHSETSSAGDLERLILTDQALAAKVLGVANSAYYGVRETITTIRQAVVLIGLVELQDLVLGVSVIGLFNPKVEAQGVSIKDLWAHSIAVAASAAALAAASPRPLTAENAFTAGLLHDLGKPLLLTLFPDYFAQVVAHARSHTRPFIEAERAIVGVTHDALGDLYTRAAFFPERLQVGIGDHHEPALKADPPGLDVVVHLADGLVNRLAAGELAPAMLFPEAADRLGLGPDEAEQVVEQALGQTGSVLEALL